MSTVSRVSIAVLALVGALGHSELTRAHVGLERPDAPTGFYKAVFKVPHGCEGQATHTVRVTLPEGAIAAKPMPKSGWQLATTSGAYAQAYEFLHGKTLTEGVKEIVWSGGSLPDAFYDEFVVQMFLAKTLKSGSTLAFPVTQECESGRLAWAEIAAQGVDPHSLKFPAPVLKIADAQGGSAAAPYRIGDITISKPWTRATAKGAPVGAGYLVISNSGKTADKLLKVSFEIAGRSEIHTMDMTDGVMRMRKLENLDIPAGGEVQLAPGGLHLMLMELKGEIAEGTPVRGVLEFEKAGSITIDLDVQAMGAKSAPDHSQH